MHALLPRRQHPRRVCRQPSADRAQQQRRRQRCRAGLQPGQCTLALEHTGHATPNIPAHGMAPLLVAGRQVCRQAGIDRAVLVGWLLCCEGCFVLFVLRFCLFDAFRGTAQPPCPAAHPLAKCALCPVYGQRRRRPGAGGGAALPLQRPGRLLQPSSASV
ncbi:hypothetical protein ABPG75_010772 [Micractinium tetrahymenae]